MKASSRRFALILMASVAAAATFGLARNAEAGGQVTIGVTETIASYNPYADSISMGYAIWCQVYGCLGIYDYEKGDYVGMLVERWEVDKADKNVWTFHLNRGVKRHNDGVEFTSADVIHSVDRINNDPQSKQKQNISPIKDVVALDKYTVKIVTKQPTASLLEYIFDRVIISAKDLYDKHGAREVDRKYPWGWGPYKLKELVIGQRIVLEKDTSHPAVKPQNPDTLIFSIMREAEQRVTALINNEYRASSGQLGRDHVSGHESQVQAVGQSQTAAGGLPRHRSRPHHQERAERSGRPARRPDWSGPVRL
jgi:peptide/nickel transport system substrate-binding protein